MTNLDEIPLPSIAPRQRHAHKGDFGRAVLIGGSRGMAGAIGLAGAAALRSGAGLVTLAVPHDILRTVAAYERCYMTWPLPSDNTGRVASGAFEALKPLLERATCVAIGPGLNRSAGVDALVEQVFMTTPVPVVLDADALNVVADIGISSTAGARVLTPHPGEFRRLCASAPHDRSQMENSAHEWAANHGVVLILKGQNSLITDGTRRAHNVTGNPGMATGGTGDVLTGVITGLLSQGFDPLDAARLGAHLHGLAGDLACAELGEVGMIASDVLRFLPMAFREYMAA
jgi:NAD(P)H-hydrate epimerase